MKDNSNIIFNTMILPPIILFVIAISLIGCSYINKSLGKEDDWAGEEFTEEVIKLKTGLDIDLTPDSKECCKSN